MSRGIVILLCNLTTSMAAPWLANGYDIIMVDPQHRPKDWAGAGVYVAVDGAVTRIGGTILQAMPWISTAIRSGRVVFVGGFPPCTDVAVSGALHFAAKREKDPHFQAKAALVFEQCRMIGEAAGCPWFAENPASVFSTIFGPAQNIFQPWHYTGLVIEDNYTKTTHIWSGGGLEFPEPEVDGRVLAAVDLWAGFTGRKGLFARYFTLRKTMRKAGPTGIPSVLAIFTETELGLLDDWLPDDRIHKCSPGEERANIRSATPGGWSLAMYRANAPHLKPLRAAA